MSDELRRGRRKRKIYIKRTKEGIGENEVGRKEQRNKEIKGKKEQGN